MNSRRLTRSFVLCSFLCALASPALGSDPTGSLDGGNLILALARIDTDGTQTTLDSDGLAHYLSQGRCLCPTNLVTKVTLDTTGAAALGSSQADVSLVVGNDCADLAATGCTTVGQDLTLSASKTWTSVMLTTSSLFTAALGKAGCGNLSATSSRLWAIVRVAGSRVSNPPSLAIGLGGSLATAPTAVSAESADKGLMVSWTEPKDTSAIAGYQVLCSPAGAKETAAYEMCTEAIPATSSGVFATLDATLVCSALVPVGQHAVRVSGLDNGTSYQVAVIAVGNDGLPSAPSQPASNSPAPTTGFEDLYRAEGGTATPGCSLAVPRGGARGGAVLLVGLLLAWRRRLRRWLLVLPFAALAASPARAGDGDEFAVAAREPVTGFESPRVWNLELRFGPYRPDVDSELAERGAPGRPYAEMFGSSRHLMSQLEIDRQLVHRWGTLGVGFGAGYFKVSAAALTSDQQARSKGDHTALRLIPLSLSLVYRADFVPPASGIPFAPFLKAGLDAGLWSLTDSSDAGPSDGVTLGWHAAIGGAMYLDFIDPEAAHSLDQDSGVNHVAVFIEWGRYALDGLGAADRLHVGDTTWLAGMMMEL